MFDQEEFSRWRDAADDARRGAAAQTAAALYNWACFLAEQSGQLAMKGLLHGVGRGAWGHDLVELGRVVEQATDESLPPAVNAALRRLSRHYIPARYPDAHPSGPPGAHYGASDAADALSDLDIVLHHVDATWARISGIARQEHDGT